MLKGKEQGLAPTGRAFFRLPTSDNGPAQTTASDLIETLQAMRNEAQARHLSRFFKTGKGQYGEGDRFLGLRVPQTRAVTKEAKGLLTADELALLLQSPWHEARLCALLLLVEEMGAALPRREADTEERAARRQAVAAFYLHHARRANNWDLVDLSAPGVLGQWLLCPLPGGGMPDRSVLDRLAASDNLWEQRIAIVSTLALIRAGEFGDTLRIARLLLRHPHDLIHKAVGWMLREVGKRDLEVLRRFLREHAPEMPRTSLRYAIERMEEGERMNWLKGSPGSPSRQGEEAASHV